MGDMEKEASIYHSTGVDQSMEEKTGFLNTTHPKSLQPWCILGVILSIQLFFLFLYLNVLSQDLSIANFGSDGGDFLAAALTLGVPHPSGYPLYIFLLRIIQNLPVGSPYFKGSLISLIPFIMAIGVLSIIPAKAVQPFWQKIISVISTALLFGSAPLIVSQAVIVEVYGLQMLVSVFYILWIFIIYAPPPKTNHPFWLILLSIGCGLGLANHLTTLFLAPLYVIGWIGLIRQGYSRKTVLVCSLFYLAGLSIYAYLPWLAAQDPPVNWGSPKDFISLIWLVSGQLYQNLAGGITLLHFWERLKALAGILFDNLTVPGILAGLFYLDRPRTRPLINASMIYIFGVMCVFSLVYASNDSLVYLIPALTVFCVWAGLAVETLWVRKSWKIPWGKGLIILLVVFILFRIPSIPERVDPHQEKGAALFANQVMLTAPQNAIILTSGDEDTFPLWYYHYGLKQRSDIQIIVLGLFRFDWYRGTLLKSNPALKITSPGDSSFDPAWMKDFSIDNQNRPVCRSWIEDGNQLNYSFQCY